MEYNFYFDESFHDRKISYNSLESNDYFNSYISVGIGIIKTVEDTIIKAYSAFENKYKDKTKYSVRELKSDVINKKHYKYGISSFNKLEVDFYSDFFDFLVNGEIIYYIYICDKFEYLLNQCKVSGFKYLNIPAAIYSITKAINVYRPKNVIMDVMNKDKKFLIDLKEFLINQIRENGDLELKRYENEAMSNIVRFLDFFDVSSISFDFDYRLTFEGLKLFQSEINAKKINIFVDKEGTGKICKGAKSVGYNNVMEVDSLHSCGIRMSDMFSGFISRMMHALYEDTRNNPSIPYKERHLLNVKWFDVNEKQFNLYKRVAKYIMKEDNIYYSTFVSRYFDLFAEFIGLIRYFDCYATYEEYTKLTIEEHHKRGNDTVLSIISYFIKRMEY